MTKPFDLGAAELANVGPDEYTAADREKRRLIKIRADGNVVYIGETVQAGVYRARTVGMIERWRDKGEITPGMFEAAEGYAQIYRHACLGPRYATGGLTRIDCTRVSREESVIHLERRRQGAQRRLDDTHHAVGPIMAGILEDVLGHGMTLKEYARRQRWGGKSSDKHEARGMLKLALGVLARHAGYE